MTREHLLWVAGLFEGEGSVSRSNGRWQVALSMTDEDVIKRLAERTGSGFITQAKRAGRKTIYYWRVTQRLTMLSIMEQLLPEMGDRRAVRMRQAVEELQPALSCPAHQPPPPARG